MAQKITQKIAHMTFMILKCMPGSRGCGSLAARGTTSLVLLWGFVGLLSGDFLSQRGTPLLLVGLPGLLTRVN